MRPLAERLGRLYAAADPDGQGIAEHVAEARPAASPPRVAIVAEFGGNTSPGLLFHEVFVGLKEKHGEKMVLVLVVPVGLDQGSTRVRTHAHL